VLGGAGAGLQQVADHVGFGIWQGGVGQGGDPHAALVDPPAGMPTTVLSAATARITQRQGIQNRLAEQQFQRAPGRGIVPLVISRLAFSALGMAPSWRSQQSTAGVLEVEGLTQGPSLVHAQSVGLSRLLRM